MNKLISVISRVIMGFYAFIEVFSLLFNGFSDNSITNFEIITVAIVAGTLSVRPNLKSFGKLSFIFGSSFVLIGIFIQLHFIYLGLDRVASQIIVTLIYEGVLLLAFFQVVYETACIYLGHAKTENKE